MVGGQAGPPAQSHGPAGSGPSLPPSLLLLRGRGGGGAGWPLHVVLRIVGGSQAGRCIKNQSYIKTAFSRSYPRSLSRELPQHLSNTGGK